MQPVQHLLKDDTAVNTLTAASFPVTVASLTGYLPPIAALLSIIWIAMQILFSAEAWLERRREKRAKKNANQ